MNSANNFTEIIRDLPAEINGQPVEDLIYIKELNVGEYKVAYEGPVKNYKKGGNVRYTFTMVNRIPETTTTTTITRETTTATETTTISETVPTVTTTASVPPVPTTSSPTVPSVPVKTTAPIPSSTKPSEPVKSVETGDRRTEPVYILILAVGASVLAVSIYYKRKNK
ncbi:MAG: hypothetical protein E7F64_07375 [Clostridiales bacterium]|nr:hypothetical protein [Clostridiales bacterium]